MAPPPPSSTHQSLWNFDASALQEWAKSLEVFEQRKPSASPSGAAAAAAASDESKNSSITASKIPPEIATKAWANLQTALSELQTKVVETTSSSVASGAADTGGGAAKDSSSSTVGTDASTGKSNNSNTKRRKGEILAVVDPYNIYRHTMRLPQDDEEDVRLVEDEAARDIKDTMGGKLTQLTISGLVNGFAGVLGGVVKNKRVEVVDNCPVSTDSIPSAGGASLAQLKYLANMFSQSIQTKVEADALITTPLRIQQMLAPELSENEIKNIRSRIYETVILGKGVNQIEEDDVPTAGPNAQNKHAAEKFKRCQNCSNTDQSLFVMDRKNGDVICENCGTVVEESLMHEGSQYRKFEGEVDRNHHGDAANRLQSNAYNMSTTLGGVQITTGAGVGGFGSQNKNGLETVLRNAHAYTELNISNFGKGDRRTRIGYKDQQKRNAFYQMGHIGDALHLHEAVVQRAKEVFAGFRDDRELVVQFKGVLAACLCEAFDELSKDGRRILKQREVAPSEVFNNARATRRNELHHANLAGRGGLMLDKDGLSANIKPDEPMDEMSVVVRKPASTWTVDDCRTWLMEAAKTISLVWVDERKKGAKNIPDGSQEELEGQMIEHAFTLCDKLEVELEEEQKKKGVAGAARGAGRGRVNTPRVQSLGKLSIKWQHSHERGSGGKGGVGGSGQQPSNGGGKTAGQILILKSPRKIGNMINDKVAGEAIHKELQTLKSKQRTLKRQKLLEEQSKQRHQQMQRKPWLSARAAQVD
mmetsp:Transcript_25969/g.61628  ORF Transcript_25969/g.61628 Transcript_25969/m.61628 type:complete len:759 (-) Transcript_25969:76-2352(-)